MFRMTGSAILSAIFLAIPSFGFAGLEVCNDTDELRAIAVGVQQGDKRVSEGWWPLEPDECKTPLVRDLTDLEVFIFAKGKDAPAGRTGREFCVAGKAFATISADDCAKQGQVTQLFRPLKRDTTQKNVTVRISQIDMEAREEANLVLDSALFRSCDRSDDTAYTGCVFSDAGVRYRVGSDTSGVITAFLKGLAPASPILVRGRIVEQTGPEMTIILKEVRTRPATEHDQIFQLLQGQWVSEDDPLEKMAIIGAEKVGTYDGTPTGTDFLSLPSTCDDTELVGEGRFLQATDSSRGDVYCYAIETLSKDVLTLSYAPRGNLLVYLREERE